jgi:hypothetical protein
MGALTLTSHHIGRRARNRAAVACEGCRRLLRLLHNRLVWMVGVRGALCPWIMLRVPLLVLVIGGCLSAARFLSTTSLPTPLTFDRWAEGGLVAGV